MNKNLLTIGITTHGNKVDLGLVKSLVGQPVNIIISEDLEDLSNNLPDYCKELSESGMNFLYVFSDLQGIANNRDNLLKFVNTKYFYIIDNDDKLLCNYQELNKFLEETDYDAIYIKCYEDGKFMGISRKFIYMTTWMQIFNTEWFRKLGGYVQSWNFIHEECATNLNMISNLGKNKYRRKNISKKIISYHYHANGACNVRFDVAEVCKFIKNIRDNEKIKNKKDFLKRFRRFAECFFPVYRIIDGNSVYIDNFINGSLDDILCLVDEEIAKIK